MSSPQLAYHTKCTGQALATVQATQPASEQDAADKLCLFGACFCPFVQRAWAVLCFLSPPSASSPWTYVEVDPYKKPAALLEVSPKGLVPAVKLEKDASRPDVVRGICESTVIMEYFIDRFGASPSGATLLPPPSQAYERAQYKMAADRVNRTLIPAFYRFLQAQEPDKQVEHSKEYVGAIESFVRSMDSVVSKGAETTKTEGGPFWDGSDSPSFVDFMAAPWLFRTTNVLKHYRALDIDAAIDPDLRERYVHWQRALFAHPAWAATVSDEELYLESYARYAENRPNTSQVANAINQGRGLP